MKGFECGGWRRMDFKRLMQAMESMVKRLAPNQEQGTFLSTSQDLMRILSNEGERRINPKLLESVKAVKPLPEYPYDMDKKFGRDPYLQMNPSARLDAIDRVMNSGDLNNAGLFVPELRTAYIHPDYPTVLPHELAHSAQTAVRHHPKKYAEFDAFHPWDMGEQDKRLQSLRYAFNEQMSPSIRDQFHDLGDLTEGMADAAAMHFYHPDLSPRYYSDIMQRALQSVFK